MLAVWKYQIAVTDEFVLSLPVGAKILSAQSQNNSPQLWVLVDTEETQKEARLFRQAGTGHPIHQENLEFINTYQMLDGKLVFHLFEVDQLAR